MPVFKNESNNTWYVMARYVNWKGERKQKCKRGFTTKREAQEWERMFQLQTAADLDMSFEAFMELYTRDMKNRLKENTWLTKEHIIRTKILPYFAKLKISEITTKEVVAWQNEMTSAKSRIRRLISRRCTISFRPFLIMPFATTGFAPIRLQRWETWAARNTRKCCSGQPRNTRDLPMK